MPEFGQSPTSIYHQIAEALPKFAIEYFKSIIFEEVHVYRKLYHVRVNDIGNMRVTEENAGCCLERLK